MGIYEYLPAFGGQPIAFLTSPAWFRGVVIGYLKDVRAPEGTTIEEVFLDCLEPLGIPVAMGLEAGHGAPCRTLPLGVSARLDASAGTLEVLEPVVE